MFGEEARKLQLMSCPWKLYHRRMAFAHRHHMLPFHLGQQLTEAPYAAHIFRQSSSAPLSPDFLQAQSELPRGSGPLGVHNFQQLAAFAAAEHLVAFGLHHAAVHTAQHVSSGAGFSRVRLHRPASWLAVTTGRRQTGMLASALEQNSSWMERTTTAASAAGTAKQMLNSLAPCATAITLTSRRATAEKTRPRMPHVPFIDS